MCLKRKILDSTLYWLGVTIVDVGLLFGYGMVCPNQLSGIFRKK